MEAIQKIGVKIIIQIQEVMYPTFNWPMKLLSYTGEELFYMAVIPFIFWCIHPGIGIRLFVFLVLNSYVNSIFKWFLHGPRPYWIDSNVHALYPESSYGVPSGHSQNALGVPIYLAQLLNKYLSIKWFWYVAFFIMITVSFSRMYLGVHFPHDVLGGWTLGTVMVLLFVFLGPRLTDIYNRQTSQVQITISIVVPIILIFLGYLVLYLVSGIQDPALWEQNASLAAPPKPGRSAVNPRNVSIVVTTMGVLSGCGVGTILMKRYSEFEVAGAWPIRILRYLLGMVGLLTIQFGLGFLFPKEPEWLHQILRFIRYFSIALWVMWLAPLIFIRLGLAKRAISDPSSR